jgi:hypothetical protein
MWSNRYEVGSGWGVAQAIEASGDVPTNPQVAVDGSGRVIAVWQAQDATPFTNIWSNSFTPGSGWGTATIIESIASNNCENPQVAVEDDGDAFVVWQASDGMGTGYIWANQYSVSGGWGTEVLLDTQPEAQRPAVAVDNNGNAVVAWQSDLGGRYIIRGTFYWASGGWRWVTLVGLDSTANCTDPQVAYDPNGDAIAIWLNDNDNEIFTNRFVLSENTWGTDWEAFSNSQDAEPPALAIDANGNMIVVWSQYDASSYYNLIKSNRYTAATGWEGPVTISSVANSDGYYPDVAIDASGAAMAVWRQSDVDVSIYANRFE